MATIADIVTGAAQRYGVDPQALLATAQIESRLNPLAENKHSTAAGLFQFIDRTAGDYGLTNKLDPYASADAAGRLWRDNAASLRSALGHDPTPADLYLAHQQGAGGARSLLADPNRPAIDVVGEKALLLNGGKPGMTAGQFADIWRNKFNQTLGQPVTSPEYAPAAPGAQAAPAPATPSLASLFAEPDAIAPPNPWAAALSSVGQRQTVQDDGKARSEAERARKRALFAPI